MARPEWIEVGKITRPHGLHGEVRIAPSSDNPSRFLPGAIVYGRPGAVGMAKRSSSQPRPLVIERVRGEEESLLVTFQEVYDRDAAEALRGYVLEIRSSDLPDLETDEYYPFDLIGLSVLDPTGGRRGEVVDTLECPAHALLVVKLDKGEDDESGQFAGQNSSAPGREILVPFVRETVPVVDVAAGYLVVKSSYLE